MEANIDFPATICGLECVARQYVGIGHLNVSTPRGELKLVSGDYIVKFGDGEVLIMNPETFLVLAEYSIDIGSEGILGDVHGEEGDPGEKLEQASDLGVQAKAVLDNIGATSLSFEVLKMRKQRGEKLTDLEEARLIDGK